MFRDTVHEKSLFHVKPSRVTFEGILPFFVRLLAGNIFFYFSKKHNPASFYSVDTTVFETRREIIDLEKPAGGRPPSQLSEFSGILIFVRGC